MKCFIPHRPPADPSVVEKLLRARSQPVGKRRLGKFADAGRFAKNPPGHGNWKSREAQKKRITLPRMIFE